ncbi:MAG: type II toxin-antitoxin system ParD family antitoxin [Betaproteobacteria bacterium]|nr:type II toxin-antitoxin system ParD family antitoxin [Betaproteobacteria bacterium]
MFLNRVTNVADMLARMPTSVVIVNGQRLFETYHSVQQTRLAALKADIDQGFADIEAGRVSPVNMVDIKTEGRRLRKSS